MLRFFRWISFTLPLASHDLQEDLRLPLAFFKERRVVAACRRCVDRIDLPARSVVGQPASFELGDNIHHQTRRLAAAVNLALHEAIASFATASDRRRQRASRRTGALDLAVHVFQRDHRHACPRLRPFFVTTFFTARLIIPPIASPRSLQGARHRFLRAGGVAVDGGLVFGQRMARNRRSRAILSRVTSRSAAPDLFDVRQRVASAAHR